MKASRKGDPVEIKYLVKEGVDINETDFTGKFEMKKSLLALLVNCSVLTSLSACLGKTALHECSSRNHTRLVGYLLRHQANPNVREVRSGETPLHEAARAGHVRIIQTLLRHGADPDLVNNKGDRPIDLALNEASVTALRQVCNTVSRSQLKLFFLKKN